MRAAKLEVMDVSTGRFTDRSQWLLNRFSETVITTGLLAIWAMLVFLAFCRWFEVGQIRLSPLELLGTTFVFVSCNTGLRFVEQVLPWTTSACENRRALFVLASCSAILYVATFIDWLDGTSFGILATFIIGTSEVTSWLFYWRVISWPTHSARGVSEIGNADDLSAQTLGSVRLGELDELETQVDLELSGEEGAANIVQQLTRRSDSNGIESINGFLRGTFAADERSLNLHVGFCPPLEHRPHLEVIQVAGPEATIKIGESQTYGARLELRLQRSSHDPVDVTVHFNAITAPSP